MLTFRYDLDEIIPTQTMIKLKEEANGPVTFLVHPIEGSIKALRPVAAELDGMVYGLQCSEQVPMGSVTEVAAYYIKVGYYSLHSTVLLHITLRWVAAYYIEVCWCILH